VKFLFPAFANLSQSYVFRFLQICREVVSMQMLVEASPIGFRLCCRLTSLKQKMGFFPICDWKESHTFSQRVQFPVLLIFTVS